MQSERPNYASSPSDIITSSEPYEKSWYSQEKNVTPINEKKLTGIKHTGIPLKVRRQFFNQCEAKNKQYRI